MGGQLRVYRRRIASVKATKQITRAQELIATARIVKAQQKVAASTPYAEEITRAVSAVASHSSNPHPLTTERPNPTPPRRPPGPPRPRRGARAGGTPRHRGGNGAREGRKNTSNDRAAPPS